MSDINIMSEDTEETKVTEEAEVDEKVSWQLIVTLTVPWLAVANCYKLTLIYTLAWQLLASSAP